MVLSRPLKGTQSRNTRGTREAQDIIDAAIAQGWSFVPCTGGGNQHAKLIPPNGGVPVGVASTPSDTNFKHQIVRQMRKSGFQWPWPPQGPAVVAVEEEPLPPIEWLPVPKCSAYEFCNGGVVRNATTHKILSPAENGVYVLSDDNGFRRDYSVRALCRAAFNRPPNKKIAEIVRKETTMTVAVEASEELDSGQQDAAQREYETARPDPAEHWELVLIEGIQEGYEVNEEAEVLAPPRGPNGLRKKLTVAPWPSGTRIVLRMADKGPQQRFKLDEIVLEAFEARPGPNWVPEHIDGDLNNCARANLRWVEGQKSEEAPVPSTEPKLTSQTVATVEFCNEVEAHLDRLDAQAAEANAVIDLAEGKQPLPAEAFHLDYPMASAREAYARDPELAVALDKVAHPNGFVQDFAPGYPNDHMAQGEQLMVDQVVDVYKLEIAALPLKTRTFNILRREGIYTVAELLERTEAEISELRSAGDDTMRDVRGRLAELGFSLKPGTLTPVVVKPCEIRSYHVHEHVPSGLVLKVYDDGKVEQPLIGRHQMSILTQLIAAAEAD
jgi:hypothetical protein